MLEFIKTVIKEAGFIAKGYYIEGVEKGFKSDPTDIVTVADKEVSNFIIEKIRKNFPDHGIISEEEKDEINPKAQYTWVIDPIDGTNNFANHIGDWCVMIGIMENRRPYIGAIYDALADELFFAEVGKGAFLNDKKIQVSNSDDLDHFSIVFQAGQIRGSSTYNSKPEILKRYIKFYNNLMAEKGHWVGSSGSRLSLCRLACGRKDAVVLNAGVFHDNLPGLIITTEAGAIFTNSQGLPWQYDDMDIVVANPKLHKKIMEFFK